MPKQTHKKASSSQVMSSHVVSAEASQVTAPAGLPSTPSPVPAPRVQAGIVADGPTIARAILDLHIDVPVFNARVVGDRLELRLFGGKVAYWPAPPPVATEDEGG
jgi:hypothetical protein